MSDDNVTELRLVVTVDDFEAALHVYRDVLGLRQVAEFEPPGRVVLLDAGRATVELSDVEHAVHIDEVEVGRRVAGTLRVALRTADVDATTDALTEAGLELVASPRPTPWGSRNSRLVDADGVQLTLFT
ncbi:MAG: VOC family protein [Nitriliruptoraceae bacterium]